VVFARTLSSLHSMMVSVVCLYVLLYEDQLADDPIWLVFLVFVCVLGNFFQCSVFVMGVRRHGQEGPFAPLTPLEML